MLVMLTARGCGHCDYFRGDGVLNNGKHFMSKEYLKSILDKNLKLYNIHYSSMNGLNSDIVMISKIEKHGDTIEQNLFYKNTSNKLTHTKNVWSNNSVKKLFSKNEDMHWNQFIRSKVPINLQGYVFYFPCFGIFKIEDWNKATEGNIQLTGILNLGYTVIDNVGSIYLYKDNRYLHKRKMTTEQLIDNVLSGKIKCEPIKLRDLLNGRYDTVEEKNAEPVKVETIQAQPVVEKSKMIIIQY